MKPIPLWLFAITLIYVSLSSLFLLSCRDHTVEHQKKVAVNYDITQNHQLDYNQLFKSWINDTLPGLYKWKNQKEVNITNKEVLLDRDSLSLNTFVYYAATANGTENTHRRVGDMVDLLKEYKEPLPKEFKISFCYNVFYHPSSIERSRFAFIEEARDIVVEANTSKTEYHLIRGRLSGKKIINKVTKDTVGIEFIWRGDSLIKSPW